MMQKRRKRITRKLLIESGDVSIHPIIGTLKELQAAGYAKLMWHRIRNRNCGQEWVFDESKFARWRYKKCNVSKSVTPESGVTKSVTPRKCNARDSEVADLQENGKSPK